MESSTSDVVVSIFATEAAAQWSKEGRSSSYASTSIGVKLDNNVASDSGVELLEQNVSTSQRPPKIPRELVRRSTSLAKPAFVKSKSRFFEPPYPTTEGLDEETTQVAESKSPFRNSPKVSPRVSVGTPRATPLTPKTPLLMEEEDEEEDDDVYKSVDIQGTRKSGKKLKVFALVEWIVFISLIGLLIASLTIHQLLGTLIWSLALWKWCVLVEVIICGRLVTQWFMNIIVFIVERNFVLKKKVLYFIYGLKGSVQVFLWFTCILVAWVCLFRHGISRSRKANEVLHYITMAIAGCLVGAGIWLAKTLLIKIIALSFHVKRFFDRIQESILHQYVLQTLSGPPLMEMEEQIFNKRNSGELSFELRAKGKGAKEEVVNVDKLHRMKQEKVSAWTMRGLIQVITSTKLSTISNQLDRDEHNKTGELSEDITNEWEARAAADKIFKNVARAGHKYIEEEDLLHFMKMEEVRQIFPLFEGAIETGIVKKSALRKWVVNAYLERKSLAHSLNDSKTAVEELNKVASGMVLVIDIIVWNLMMGFLTTKILVFITSQLLLVAFMFGNTVRTVFEAIVFVFVVHPFDVGDRCVIDGVQMVVEEMNLLSTVFLRYDNEKIFYPNSVLATKPISNFYRSPEMSDSVEFALDFSTKVETIAALKARIKVYLESKPQHWRPSHSVQVKDILNMNQITMGLYVNHTINFQNIGEKSSRRSDLVLELKNIFEELGIRYHLLPQEVHVTYVGSPAPISQC